MGRYIVFDTETPNSRNDSICSIGISVVEDGKIVEERYDLVLVKDYIPDIVIDLKYAGTQNFMGTQVYEFQDLYLRYGTVIKLMSVQENLEMGAFTQKRVSQEDLDRVFNYFPRLQERRKQIAGTLSGGEQQMLAMSRALMSHPKLMMLDEPSMGLAPILVDQIFDIIKELHAAGTTILLVEQNARKALEIADRAYVLETGTVTLSGSGRELASSDAVKKAYLGG